MKYFISIIIVSAMLITLFACGGTADKPSETTARDLLPTDTTAAEETRLYASVPDIKFEGEEFIFLNIDKATMHWATHTLAVENQDGEVLNDSIFLRNLTVEAKLGIKLKDNQVPHANIVSMIKKEVTSGAGDFDAALLSISSQGDLSQGYLVDWKTIPHIDLDKPWWAKTTNDDLTIKNRLYFAAGDIGIAYYDAVMPITMNLRMAEDYKLADPYKLVLDGKWTADVVSEMMKAVTEDLNGDGIMDKNDQFGMFGMSEEYSALVVAFGEKIVKKDSEDIPFLAFDSPQYQRAFDKAVEMMNHDDIFFNYRLTKFGDTTGITLTPVWTGGQTLLQSDVIFHFSIFREMEDDFAILPRAKYDEKQSDYLSYIHQSAVLMCIPTTAVNLERTGIVLESLAAESKYTVIKTYYDITLSQKYARDQQSIKMLDIIFEHRVIDLGTVFNWASVNTSLMKQAEESNLSLGSLFAKVETQVAAAIDKFVDVE